MNDKNIKELINQYLENKIYTDLSHFDNNYYLDAQNLLRDDYKSRKKFFSLRSCFEDVEFNNKKDTYIYLNDDEYKTNCINENELLIVIDILKESYSILLEIKRLLMKQEKNQIDIFYNSNDDVTHIYASKDANYIEVMGLFNLDNFKEILNKLQNNEY